jgi:hypothetical protein
MNDIPTPALLWTYPLIEEILDHHRNHARGDEHGWSNYRGHVYRVFNMARALVPDQDHRDDKLAIAAAFHDIDGFTSLDYLGPSIGTMDVRLRRTGRGAWGEELASSSLSTITSPPTAGVIRGSPNPFGVLT